MKLVRMELLIGVGEFASSELWRSIKSQMESAVRAVEWPPGSGSFTLYPESGKKRGMGNGVKPIKTAFVEHLRSLGWESEGNLEIPGIGGMDVCCTVGDRFFCVEWETGNISSSHRSMNKMVLGLQKGVLVGGMLVLPTRVTYEYLTDRVGNFEELSPYFPVWRNAATCVREGVLAVVAVEHDALSKDVPRIPKGTDGRAVN